MKEKKEHFIELLRSTGREGMESVINYLESSAFFMAPASTAYHMSYEGGLMDHSMNVYEMAMALRGPIVAMKPGVGESLSENSIIIAALLHDICKANTYRKTKKWNMGDDGKWRQSDSYVTNYSEIPVGHGEKSLVILILTGSCETQQLYIASKANHFIWSLQL